jgi:hypothetical protein
MMALKYAKPAIVGFVGLTAVPAAPVGIELSCNKRAKIERLRCRLLPFRPVK